MMEQSLIEWMLSLVRDYRLNEFADVAGLLITVLGFGVTIYLGYRSKTAAEQAKSAVASMKNRMGEVHALAELSAAMSIMEEITRLNRAKAWPILPDRYSRLRGALIAIVGTYPNISEKDKTVLQGAISHAAVIQDQIERAIEAKESNLNIPRFNKVLAAQIDSLNEVVLSLKSNISG